MLFIRGPDQARLISDPAIRRVVEESFAEVCQGEPFDPDIHGEAVVAEAGDSLPTLEKETGLPIAASPFDDVRFPNPDFVPVWEWAEDRESCYLCVFIMTDSGGGTSLVVPKHSDIDPDLLALCARFAEPAPEPTP